MADVLTQAQIDEMLKNVAAGAVPEVTQKEEEKVKEYVYGGEVQAGLSPREMEKIFLNKTEEDIEAARLDK